MVGTRNACILPGGRLFVTAGILDVLPLGDPAV
jgi:hypothetical protein